MWEVELGGAMLAYEDAVVQAALEAAFARGEASARVLVRGQAYVVSGLQSEHRRQRLESDPTRTRRVARRLP